MNTLKPKQKVIEHPSLEDFFSYFEQINKNTTTDNKYQTENQNNENTNVLLNSEISESKINRCVIKLKNCKSPSLFDNVLNKYIKATKVTLMPLYCKLFNCVLETGFMARRNYHSNIQK